MPAAEKSSSNKRKSRKHKYGPAAAKSVASALHREKRGTLKSGKGGKGGRVTSRQQAIAIGLSEARAKRAKVPRKKKLNFGICASRWVLFRRHELTRIGSVVVVTVNARKWAIPGLVATGMTTR